MLRLKEISTVRKPRVCFCGRPLIGEFCELHGTNIRIDSFFVDADFHVTSLTRDPWLPLRDHSVRASLPQNQFLKLFRSPRQKRIGGELGGEQAYELRLTPDAAPDVTFELVTDFFEQLERDTFFGQVCLQNTQVRNSGVTIYYLCRYKILPSHSIHFYFSLIALRRLSDYIYWRLNHCHGTRENIEHSLRAIRSTVLLNIGEARNIVDVHWDSDKTLPSKVFVQNDEDRSDVIVKLPTQLYQTHEHFFLGQRTENAVLAGLDAISQQVIQHFLHYLAMNSFTGHVKKLVDPKKKYEGLLNNVITPHAQFLQIVGEKQNQMLSENGYLSALEPSPKAHPPRALLLVACSATKTFHPDCIPAILRYIGSTYLFLKSVFLAKLWPSHVDLLIVSAKYGLLKPLTPIPFYDQQLTPETVSIAESSIQEQLKTIEFNTYTECFLNLPKLYLKAITPIELVLQDTDCSIIRGQGTQAKRNNEMLQWVCPHK